MVVRTTSRKLPGIQAGGRFLQFGKKTNAFEVNDPGLAREIEQANPHDVIVTPHHYNSEPGHRYFFTVPEMPWKRKKDENENKPDGN